MTSATPTSASRDAAPRQISSWAYALGWAVVLGPILTGYDVLFGQGFRWSYLLVACAVAFVGGLPMYWLELRLGRVRRPGSAPAPILPPGSP